VNPKSRYATLKALVQRLSYETLGRRYPLDNTAVNFILPDYRLLVSGVPKVATRTLIEEIGMAEALGKSDIVSEPLMSLLRRRSELENFHKVAIVRNPWARVLSIYNSKIRSPRPGNMRTYFIRYRGLHHNMAFEAFVRWLCESEEGRDEVADRHWVSQVRFFYADGRCLVDEILRLERLNDAFAELCRKLEAPTLEFPHEAGRTTEGGTSYRHAYDEELRDLVGKRYAEDVETLGYTF
jgi:hypothetical protein